ncbi:MAG TPA: L-threonylcarbamoyladenylate synthase [Bacillota bacterium]|nr:L-threonylcarbamoyladenylate synthase [Bacillota bacterium]HPO97352.1 L-threonylcarbamoyladenylate synthase [Bacillota bacterium]
MLKLAAADDNLDSLTEAAKLLQSGELVAFPTETVYGLGAVYNSDQALAKVFQVKGRPADNPLILHIWSYQQLDLIVKEVSPKYERLMKEFWPGPLTLIFPKKEAVSYLATAGLDTVAVRMPSHPIARQLLEITDIPIAAPSANLSGRPSPTKGEHVFEDLNGKIPLIIDGGACEAGLESTVLTIYSEHPVILRPGSITKEMIEATLQEVVQLAMPDQADKPQAPGMKYRHYAPKAAVTLVEGENTKVVAKINQLLAELDNVKRVFVLGTAENEAKYHCTNFLNLGSQAKPGEVAARLYDLLRRCDQLNAELVLIEGVSAKGIGVAIENRLRKASGGNIINVS